MAEEISRRPGRRWGRIAVYAVAALTALVVLVGVALPRLVSTPWVRDRLVGSIESETGRSVQLDSTRVRFLWVPSVRVWGLELGNQEGFGPEPVFEAETVRFSFFWWSLLRGDLQSAAAEVGQPVVRYEIAPTGATNLDDLFAADSTSSGSSAMRFPFSEVRVQGGSVVIRDRRREGVEEYEVAFDVYVDRSPGSILGGDPTLSVEYAVSTDRLNLGVFYPDPAESSVFYSDLVAAHLAGVTVEGKEPDEIARERYGGVELPDADAEGTFEAAVLLDPPMRYEDVELHADLSNRRLELTRLQASMYGGHLGGSMVLDQQPAESTHLAYDFDLVGVEASSFLEQWTRLGTLFDGRLDLDIAGETPLTAGFMPHRDEFSGQGAAMIRGGGIGGDFPLTRLISDRLGMSSGTLGRFETFGGPFVVDRGRMNLESWTWQSGRTTIEFGGTVGLGGSLDLILDLDAPLSLVSGRRISALLGSSVETLEKLLSTESGTEGGERLLSYRFRIGGTLDRPTLALDNASEIRSGLQEMAVESGLDRVRRILDRP